MHKSKIKHKAKAKAISSKHAAMRLAERTECALDVEELEKRIAEGAFEFVSRLSKSRSLCRTPINSIQHVYFIMNRERRSLITILTEEQARDRLRADGHPAAERILIQSNIN